jgi:hypothetical protein
MVRTQVYLTEEQRDELLALAKTSGKKQSDGPSGIEGDARRS